MSECKYIIDRRSDELDGGWRLRMFEDGLEICSCVFPPEPELYQDPIEQAYWDAFEEAENWIVNRGGRFFSVEVSRQIISNNYAMAT